MTFRCLHTVSRTIIRHIDRIQGQTRRKMTGDNLIDGRDNKLFTSILKQTMSLSIWIFAAHINIANSLKSDWI